MNLVCKKHIVITFLGIEILFIQQYPLKLWTVINDNQQILVQNFCWIWLYFNISSDIRLDFDESVRVAPLKYLMYFLADINTK